MDFETMLVEWASLHGNCAINGIPKEVYNSFCNYYLRGSNIRFKNGIFQSRKSTEYVWGEVSEKKCWQVLANQGLSYI